MVECPINLEPIEITETDWNKLDLAGQVEILKKDSEYLVTEYKRCALRQNELTNWHRVK
jgi:hypothetical protein